MEKTFFEEMVDLTKQYFDKSKEIDQDMVKGHIKCAARAGKNNVRIDFSWFQLEKNMMPVIKYFKSEGFKVSTRECSIYIEWKLPEPVDCLTQDAT